MRRTAATVVAVLAALLAAGCSSGDGDGKVEDCAAALTERTGGDPADTPTVNEAEERVDALDKTLAEMVRKGYADVAGDAADTVNKAKIKEGERSRPEACEPLSEDDYSMLLMAKAIGGLGWTDKYGQFDKLKMLEGLRD